MGRLTKSDDRLICGVCGGIAEQLYISPIVVRFGWLLFSCFYGFGIIAYILAAIFMPSSE